MWMLKQTLRSHAWAQSGLTQMIYFLMPGRRRQLQSGGASKARSSPGPQSRDWLSGKTGYSHMAGFSIATVDWACANKRPAFRSRRSAWHWQPAPQEQRSLSSLETLNTWFAVGRNLLSDKLSCTVAVKVVSRNFFTSRKQPKRS